MKDWIEMPPQYSKTCNCGVTITGNSENGLSGLIRRHVKDGLIHQNWVKHCEIKDRIVLEKMVAE